jgi:hypothetical protein
MIGLKRRGLLAFITGALLATLTAANAQDGLAAEGEALVRKFLAPDADRRALTEALRPTEQDIRAVYGEPLASRLVATYAEMFKPGIEIGPKSGQDDIVYLLTTTAKLKEESLENSGFPGGYAKVVPLMIADVPIARFKFVKKGETLGMAFDGLIHVNGRWVLMPKPWRALGE